MNENWVEQERIFHEQQAILRTVLRLNQRRPKPIDHLSKPILIYFKKLQIPRNLRVDRHLFTRPFRFLLDLRSKPNFKQETIAELLEEIDSFSSIRISMQLNQNQLINTGASKGEAYVPTPADTKFKIYWSSLRMVIQIINELPEEKLDPIIFAKLFGGS
mmetsp:Transcript_14758/g.25106  ORF Transcript_14758/g.25106 Transcript_14758/m.25106 type:complete len:160 (+) Transcript_14758:421-900(+)